MSMQPLDVLFVPTLISLLGDRRLKSGARAALVSYGEPVLEMLRHVADDGDEDPEIRRHVPATIARIPCQQAMDGLVRLIDDPDLPRGADRRPPDHRSPQVFRVPDAAR